MFSEHKYGILSDIHEDITGTLSALAELRARGADVLMHLGDLIEEKKYVDDLVAILLAHGVEGVMGNHDKAFAMRAGKPKTSSQKYICRLPERLVYDGSVFVHTSPIRECCNGIKTTDNASKVFELTDMPIIFVGHTHVPGGFSEQRIISAEECMPLQLEKDKKYILNPGSVRYSKTCALYDAEKQTFELVHLNIANVYK